MSTHWLEKTFQEISRHAERGEYMSSYGREGLPAIVKALKKELDELEDYLQYGPCEYTQSHGSYFCGRKMCG